MSRIWRSTRDWLRQDRSTNISLSFPRTPGLVGRQPQHFPLYLVEGSRDLPYLVRGRGGHGFEVGRQAFATILGEAAERIGQPHLSQLDRTGLQAMQRPQHRPDQDDRGRRPYG